MNTRVANHYEVTLVQLIVGFYMLELSSNSLLAIAHKTVTGLITTSSRTA